MQISLNAIDWTQLTSFSTAEKFLEWYEDKEEDELRLISCYDNGWDSDSAIQYFEVAAVLEHLSSICDSDTTVHLREGIQKLVAETGQIDEFEMMEPSDGLYWISASPTTTALIKAHIDAVDLQQCVELLRSDPPTDADDIMEDLDEMFVSFIKQHSKMVDVAVSTGYGLLGQCG